MNMENRVGFAENAFFGDKARNPDYVKKVDETAEKVNVILNPIDDLAKRKAMGESIKLIRGLGIQVDRVTSLNETLVDANRTKQQKENAENVLDILAKGTYVAMRYGENKEIVADLCSGSVEKIENRLPEPLKGLGERIRANIIDDEKILNILDNLDGQRKRNENKGSLGKKTLAGKIEIAYNQLNDLELDSKKEDQREMVMAFLGAEVEDTEGAITQKEIQKPRYEKVILGEEPYDDMEGGLVEQDGPLGKARKTVEVPPQDIEKFRMSDSVERDKAFVAEQLLKITESPTGFASWWQADYAGQLINLVAGKWGWERTSKEYLDFKDFAYSSISVLGLQSVDRNADDNSANYQNFTPPKAMAELLHWDDGGEKVKILKENVVVKRVFREVFNNAFENGDYNGSGWKVVEAFSSRTDGRSQDEYVLNVLEKLKKDNSFIEECKNSGVLLDNLNELVPLGRVGMAWFEVDWLPEMVRWVHKNKSVALSYQEKGEEIPKDIKELKWFKGNGEEKGSVKENVWSSNLPYEAEVDGRKVKGELPYNHPRLARPWDLLLIKGSFLHNPGLLKQMEETMEPFIAKQLMENGRVKVASSKNIIDKYAKYNKVLDFITGGPQGFDMDNHEKMADLLKAAGNYWGIKPKKDDDFKNFIDDDFKNFIADLFALKVSSTFFPNYQSRMNSVIRGLSRLDTMSTEADRKTALRSIIGDAMNDSHGFIGECQRMYGFDLKEMPQFNEAFMKLLMDQPDIEKAFKGHKRGSRKLLLQVITSAAGTLGEVAKSFK